MKKILAFILVLMLFCALPLVTYAEGEEVSEGNSAPEEEMPTEGEISPPESVPEEEETPAEIATEWDHIKNLFSENFKDWILSHLEEMFVIISLLMSYFYDKRKHKLLNRSMGTLNNNAVTVAKSSTDFMGDALAQMRDASGAVVQYDSSIKELLEAFKTTAEEKARLEREHVEIKNYLKIESESNREFANVLAELIALSNIPNYKKEELGSRHAKAIEAIIEAAAKAEAEADNAAKMLLPATTEEVKENVGEEA
jgi:hypothetical protein